MTPEQAVQARPPLDNRSAAAGLDDPRGVRITDVSRLLGVPMATLRSWEQRYAIPAMDHEYGRHRRYLPAEVHALRLMRDEIARGQKAGRAAATVRQLLSIDGPAALFIQRLLGASEHLDSNGLRITLDEAAAVLGLPDLIDEVLLPTVRQVGRWWEAGRCDLAQQQLTIDALRGWLDRRIAFAPAPLSSRPIVLACGPKRRHTVGLESLALLLRHRAWPCRLLGAGPSTPAVLAAAEGCDAAAVVLVSHLATGRRAAVESLQALHQAGWPVFYAGNCFLPTRTRAAAPGVYLGCRIEDACTQIITSLKATEASGH